MHKHARKQAGAVEFRERASVVRAPCRHVSQFGTRTQRSDSTGTGTKTAGVRGVSSGALCCQGLPCHAICCSYVMIVASVYQLSVLSVTMLATMPLCPVREAHLSFSLSPPSSLLPNKWTSFRHRWTVIRAAENSYGEWDRAIESINAARRLQSIRNFRLSPIEDDG